LDCIFENINYNFSINIFIKDLYKSYKSIKALAGVTLNVESNSITALLGPNGAGKTTLINILTGLLKADAGEVYYGESLFYTENNNVKRAIGVVPQINNVDRDLTVIENWLIHLVLFGYKKGEIDNAIDKMLHFTGLNEHKNKKAGNLSGGLKRRLVIGRALLHNPKVLLLDEPTVGLDPLSRRILWDFIKKIKIETGCTILLTTHYIEEAERLSDYVYFISDGVIVKEGEPEILKSEMGKYALEIFKDDKTLEEFYQSRDDAVHRLESIKDATFAKIREVNLEDVYLKVTGKRIN
jgi:ABC-2 type transport system ATP-binding protein